MTMCEMTLSGFSAEAMEGRHALISRLHREVKLAEAGALATHANWVSEISSLSHAEESDIGARLMQGDYCEAGRLLGVAVRRRVLETANEKAKEHIYQQYGIELDEVMT